MKNLFKFAALALGLLLLLASCASGPVDRGIYNPKNVSEEDLAVLYINRWTDVDKIDNTAVDWAARKHQVVKIPAGVHSFSVKYNDGQVYTLFPITVAGQFERGNAYLFRAIYSWGKVGFHIYTYNNNVTGEDVILDSNKFQGNDTGILPRYIKYVLNPTMVEVGNTVKLENEKYILVFHPDMIYTLTDKETGVISKGRNGFVMDSLFKSGKTFLFETDIENMSSEQFLSSNYQEDSQIVLVPIACNETEVTYKYEKPLDQQESEITFTITEIIKMK